MFLLKAGVIEWEVPAALLPMFNFNQMATQVHMSGYFMADNLYIRREELVGILVAGEQSPIVKPTGQVLQ